MTASTILQGTRIFLCLPLLSLAQPADSPGAARADVAHAAKRGAVDAFKRGDIATGLATLRNKPDSGPGARHPDIQVVDELQEISFWLVNERHGRVGDIAALAINEAEKARGNKSAADEADLAATVGRLCEGITGDIARAKSSYEAALRANPRHEEAACGLKRIQLLEALVTAKARENEALRNRTLQPPRP